MYGLTHSELLEYGYIYHEPYCYSLPPGLASIESLMPSLLLDTEPRYPDFDPRKLPWTSAPSYIQDIIYMDISGANTTSVSSYKMPFVAVRAQSGSVDVYVGLNVGIGVASSSGAARICYLPTLSWSPKNVVCYYASFDLSYNMTSNWVKLTAETWGDTGYVKTFNSSTFLNTGYNSDLYLYGGNGIKVNDSSNYAYIGNAGASSTSSAVVNFTVNNLEGFGDGNYFYNLGSFDDVWVETFNPPTLEELSQENEKGIWDTLKDVLTYVKNLPSNIANSIKTFFTTLGDRISGFFEKLVEDIKGLFIPSDSFFDTYVDQFQDYFRDCLGILYEVPEYMILTIELFADYEPATEDYCISFPEIVIPVYDNGEWYNHVLIEETLFEFDFLEDGPLSILYSFYRSFIWLTYIYLLINLIIRKSNKVLGGGSG